MVKAGIIREKNMNFKGKATLDDDLVISAIRGNKEAFINLIEEYKEYLYKTAYLYVKNQHEASDIYQETVYKAFISIYKLRRPEYFKTWITRILINNVRDSYRKSKKVVFLEDNELLTENLHSVDKISNIDLYNAIDSLCVKHKTAIILRYIHDMPIKDIAKVMRCSENTVKSYIHRALKSLKIDLKEE
ncbi:RNA polymerase sigma-70 factor (ECF subfamily) [Anoxybacillus vitaminiphilus]|uniref:RNA polymerase sigma-70 factor (ECF subfamily) n=1 Tax=Paranoxybacillus vitaminiphilus TaxID=581036 RepID=A0A327Y285_9BACL|nr:sigma-70 family RNA polymerase sigma factor [Anoxybacillus vitaminiphilus]RAK15200.1 RNA polymerase sigma-70 factor (ECF subfamily) [Anoxybacillus vitaminiphilus]